jgi:catechol 2,3-dioxygenase-like lactoylglutathione lyase family enzyme
MAYRINHIHLKAPDPRKTAEWYAKAFAFKIVNDEVRVFGDRFIRCQSEDGGMMVNISGARSGETPSSSSRTSLDSKDWGRGCWKGRSRSPTARASRSCGLPTTSGSS